jgi:adenylate cyclase
LRRFGRWLARVSGQSDWPTRIAGAVLVLALFALQVWDPPIIEAARLRVFDQLQRLAPREVPATSSVVIVDIDDASLTEIGQWPWPRTVFADLVSALVPRRPRAIAFDVLLAEADRLSPPQLAPWLEPVSPEAAAILRQLPSNESQLAVAMAVLPVVLGEAGAVTGFKGWSQVTDPPAKVAWLGGDLRGQLPTFPYAVAPRRELAEAARGLGLVSILPEIDGVVRRAPTLAVVEGRPLPALALEAVRVALGESAYVVRGDEIGIRSVAVGPVSVPTDGDGRIWIHYTPRRTELYVPARAVLAGEVPAERLAGRIVLIGASATALSDVRVTPVAGNTPGVEVQAQLVESILAGDLLQRPAALIGGEQVAVLGIGLLLALFGTRLPAGLFPPLVGLVIALAVALAWYAFTRGYLVDTAFPAFAFGVLLFWLAMAKYIREEARRRSLRDAFGHYLSPVMVDRLVGNPTALALEGERKGLTVLFSDIRSFTSMGERYADDPVGLTRLLNRYFTAMTEEILARDGTIDKYIGDAIMAFWNAPLDDPEHPRHACLAALGMLRRLAALNRELAAELAAQGQDFAPLRIGIGIETGEAFVGNMGSAQRFNYSVIGDAVNVASRLESSSKTYGFPIIVGSHVRAACPELAFLELEAAQLRGRQQTTDVHALVGDDAARGHTLWRDFVAAHATMMQAVQEGAEEEVVERLWQRCEALATRLEVRDAYTSRPVTRVTFARASAGT